MSKGVKINYIYNLFICFHDIIEGNRGADKRSDPHNFTEC
mgnify:CR=1 FL=1